MINWIMQVVSLSGFALRTIPQRKGAALAAAVGIAGVVLVLVGVLSIAEGFKAALTVNVPTDVAIVLRQGADSEMTSIFTRQETRLVADAPGVSLASPELFVMINLPKRATHTDANVPLRGVSLNGMAVRGDFKIIAGKAFKPGRNQVIVGAGAARAFAGLEIGNTIKVGPERWEVVGIFTGGSGAAESEIWTDAAVLQPAYQREDTFQSVMVRLNSERDFQQFKDALTANPRLKVKVWKQAQYLDEKSTMLTTFVRGIGFFIASMMALGALFGALNTMYSAVASRTREIATLRALGFGAAPVILSIMIESLALALAGGAASATLAFVLFNGYQASTINWQTFSQIAFSFAVTPRLLATAITGAALLGLIGGLFPAIRAARLPIASALRET